MATCAGERPTGISAMGDQLAVEMSILGAQTTFCIAALPAAAQLSELAPIAESYKIIADTLDRAR